MTEIPADGTFTDPQQTNDPAKLAQDQQLLVLRELLGGPLPTTAAIAGGTLTPANGSNNPRAGAPSILVRTENDAASDDLTNLVQTEYRDGALTHLTSAFGAITVRHGAGGAGQLLTADEQDLLLEPGLQSVIFQRRGAAWHEVARAYELMTLALATAPSPVARAMAISPSVLQQAVAALGGPRWQLLGTLDTSSGTEAELTNIPAGASHIDIALAGVSLAGAADLLLEIGDATAYAVSSAGRMSVIGTSSSSAGNWPGTGPAQLTAPGTAPTVQGVVSLVRQANNNWSLSGAPTDPASAASHFSSGQILLAGEATRLKLASSSAVALDGGSAAVWAYAPLP